MATTIKQRHKQESKALNLECEQRLAGKKGAERDEELKAVANLKKNLAERHARELEDEAVKEAENPTPAETSSAPKLSKARQRELKKEAKEAEEKKKREEEAKNRGPTARDREMAALENELKKLGLHIEEISPDGNCLYGSVSHQLQVREGKTITVPELRKLTSQVMSSNPAQFEPFLPEGETLKTYLPKVEKNGEWGGELEVRALSMGLERQIWVHRINTPTVKMGLDEKYDPSQTLHITYHEHQFALGEHYNSAAPNNTH